MSLHRIIIPALCAALAALPSGTAERDEAPVPVLVELYTSEGCSSCPRADALLDDLLRSQPVRGVRIVGLGQHVDYWNRLGWTDPFSSPASTARQRDYASSFRNGSIYTPQMIVDGREEFVGGDRGRAITAIERAAGSPKAAVVVELREIDDDASVSVDIAVAELPEAARRTPFDVMLAVTERDLITDVRRGENAGRRLRHASVVREIRRVASIDDPFASLPLELPATVAIAPAWKRRDVAFVVFLQERKDRRVLGIGSADLAR